MDNPSPTLRTITLPFHDYISDLIPPYKDKVSVPTWKGELISKIDKAEDIVHVEFPTQTNGLNLPEVWRVKEWRESYRRWLDQKAKSDQDKLEWDNYKYNLKVLCYKLTDLTGLPKEECVDTAMLLLNKNVRVVEKQFEVKLKIPFYKKNIPGMIGNIFE